MAVDIGALTMKIAASPKAFLTAIGKMQGKAEAFTQSVSRKVDGLSAPFKRVAGAINKSAEKINGLIGAALNPFRFADNAIQGLFQNIIGDDSVFTRITKLRQESDLLGISMKEIAGLEFASGVANVDFEDVTESFRDLVQNIGEAVIESQEARKELRKVGKVEIKDLPLAFNELEAKAAGARQSIARLGLDIESLGQKTKFDQFKAVVERLAKIQDSGQRAAIGAPLLGEDNFRRFNALIDKFGGNIDKAIKQAERMGLAFSRMDAEKVERAQAATRKLQMAFEGIKRQAAIALAPAVESLVKMLSDLIDRVGAANIGRKIAKIVAAIIDAVVFAVKAISSLISKVSSMLDGLGSTIKFLADVGLVGSGNTVAKRQFDQFLEHRKMLEKAKEDQNELFQLAGQASKNLRAFGDGEDSRPNAIDTLAERQRRVREGLNKILSDISSGVVSDVSDPIAKQVRRIKELGASLDELRIAADKIATAFLRKNIAHTDRKIRDVGKLPIELEFERFRSRGVAKDELQDFLNFEAALLSRKGRADLIADRTTENQKIISAFEEMARAVDLPLSKLDDMRKVLGQIDKQKTFERMREEAGRLLEGLKGPNEQLKANLSNINRLRERGALFRGEARELALKTIGNRISAISTPSVAPLPSAIESGSAQAFSVIAKANRDVRATDSPEVRNLREMKRILERSVKAEEDTARKTERLRDEVRELVQALVGK